MAPHQDLWAFSQEPENFITNIACVVRHPNGKWFELACPVCHGNRSSDRRRGFFSAKGFYDHLRQGHGESNKGVGLLQIIERCQVRELSGSEVEELRNAGSDSSLIRSVATTTAITQKKSKAVGATRKVYGDGFDGLGLDDEEGDPINGGSREGERAVEAGVKRSGAGKGRGHTAPKIADEEVAEVPKRAQARTFDEDYDSGSN
ncbi:hypothetical protein LTR56_011118 [Elasticomyces elasticus]|nr:hypothetical protein LTR56_011118 [Elasticomyces elasticus]KAK3662462.1 hypothetical protein LTR22_006741 [Elasticomyces elasticus]KAK4926451.1 hypothetical protein LTR49_006658 [Elasticomyces elasticus]KAK5761176.1 hypothetical protein LTS12_008657 [Elasticomyces elasticus]